MSDSIHSLSTTSAEQCAQIVKVVAERLRDEKVLTQAIEMMPTQTSSPGIRSWDAFSIAEGHAGVALLFAQLESYFPGEGWDVAGHRHLARALHAAQEESPPRLGLFNGLSGVAFAAWRLSQGGSRYKKALAAIEAHLFPQAVIIAEQLRQQTQGLPIAAYDALSGLTGMGAYLLCRSQDAQASGALRQVLASLIYLTQEYNGIPYWYTSPQFALKDAWRDMYPSGYLNCGFAHGVPSMLAVLSLAYLQGVRVDGLEEGIERATNWIMAHQIQDSWGPNWPALVPVNPAEQGPPSTEPSHSAWCYGNPGIARAIWLAGEAVNSATYRAFAIESMCSVFRRPESARRISSPTFCHGYAGLLHITLYFARATHLPVFWGGAAMLLEQLIALYDEASLLGFKSRELLGNLVDSPGLLDGAAGIALVLLSAGTEQKAIWDRVFILS